jgi:hypothetical protein
MTSFAWVIEAPGQNYLGTTGMGMSYEFRWTKDHMKALRFMSKAQADSVMMAVRQGFPALFAFAALLGDARPVEHGWITERAEEPVLKPEHEPEPYRTPRDSFECGAQ